MHHGLCVNEIAVLLVQADCLPNLTHVWIYRGDTIRMILSASFLLSLLVKHGLVGGQWSGRPNSRG